MHIERVFPARVRVMAAVLVLVLLALAGFASGRSASAQRTSSARWTNAERDVLRSLTLAAQSPLAPDRSNRVGDNARAASLGRDLFFDTRLSANGRVACATCHLPDRNFQDDKPLADGVGRTARRTMPIAGTARSPWLFWDGRAGSQWEQALGPLESAVEHGGTRLQYARVIATHYRTAYESVFGALPSLAALPASAGPHGNDTERQAWQQMPPARREQVSRVFANIGKAIAAYERTVAYGPSRFDRYVAVELAGHVHDSTSAFTKDEEAGLRLFIGKASCINCHNGAQLTDDHFHNTGVGISTTGADSGRALGVRSAVDGEFSCVSPFSDATADECDELRFASATGAELLRAFKAPSLRNVAERAPYMHAGQIATLEAVVAHYSAAPRAPFGTSELRPLRLSRNEQAQLVAYLRTLSGPVIAPLGIPRSFNPR